MSSIVKGIIPPVLTPMKSDRSIDFEALERLVEHLIAGGVDGLFALGSSGEVAFLSDEDRATVIREIVRIAAGRVPVYAGVIDMQVNRMLGHIKAAEEAGVDAIVATAPFYAICGPAEVEAHFLYLLTMSLSATSLSLPLSCWSSGALRGFWQALRIPLATTSPSVALSC